MVYNVPDVANLWDCIIFSATPEWNLNQRLGINPYLDLE